MSQEQSFEKIRQLIRVIESIDPDQLDMTSWRSEDNDCGTVACIAGHAGLDPWFRDRGFCLEEHPDGEYILCFTSPDGRTEDDSWTSITEFFKPAMTYLDALRILGGNYPGHFSNAEILHAAAHQLRKLLSPL